MEATLKQKIDREIDKLNEIKCDPIFLLHDIISTTYQEEIMLILGSHSKSNQILLKVVILLLLKISRLNVTFRFPCTIYPKTQLYSLKYQM